MLTRRDCLKSSALALNHIALLTTSSDAKGPMHSPYARLSLNENPFGPSPLALEAIQRGLPNLCRYVGDGADVLTQAIVTRESVSADQIVLGDVLAALGRHLAMNGPIGGEFIYSTPGYTALVDAASSSGGVAIGVALNDELQNDLRAIAAKINERTRGIYLVNPHNPSGTVSEAAAFWDFVREMSKRTTVIVDEAYLEFEPDFALRTAVELTRSENVVVFRTFDKIYGLASLSLGYAIAPTALTASLKQDGVDGHGTLDGLALAAAASLQNTWAPQGRR